MAQRRNSSRTGASARGKKGPAFSVAGLVDVALSGKSSTDAMDEAVRIRVHVGRGADRALACAVRDALAAERAGGFVEVLPLAAPPAGSLEPDAALLVAGPGEPGCAPLARFYASSGVPVAFVCETALDAPDPGLPPELAGYWSAVAASEPGHVPAKLGEWLAGKVGARIALAANFPCCRPAVVRSLILSCALENAAVGAVEFIPGADFPVMTASQAKLALDIAAAHGQGLSPARAAELAGVLGAGLAYRAGARAALGLVPGLGWALKAGVGLAGTVATGRAVEARFSGAAPGADALRDLLARFFPRGKKRPAPATPAPSAPLPPAAAPPRGPEDPSDYIQIGG